MLKIYPMAKKFFHQGLFLNVIRKKMLFSFRFCKGSNILFFVCCSAVFMIGCRDIYGDKYESYYQKGLEYAIQKKFEKARGEFERVLKVKPTFMPADGSLKIVEDVLNKQVSEAAAVHIFKGIDYGNMGEVDKKIREISKAIVLNPGYALAYNERGIAYTDKGLLNEAISDKDRAIFLNPIYAAPYYNKAVDCEKIGRFLEAIDAYKHFIEYGASSRYQHHIQYAKLRIRELTELLSRTNVEV